MTTPPANPSQRYDLCGAAHDFPVWDGPPRRSILICSHPRSGSTMLGEALYFAGGLGCALEYLHVGFRPGFETRWGVSGLPDLTRKVWRHRTDPSGTLAIKLFWRELADIAETFAPGDFPCLRSTPADQIAPASYRALRELLETLFPDAVHIHLARHDRLRQAISGTMATQSGLFRQIGTMATDAPVAAYDFDQISSLILSSAFCHAHWQAFFRANGLAAYPLTYEELIADYAAVVERLLRWLGHDGAAPAIRMERQASATSEAWMQRFLRDQRALAEG